jgi:hypothetical protein
MEENSLDNRTVEPNSSNEWINWIEDAIHKETIKYFDYDDFGSFQKIGAGSFGEVYRVNWRNSNQHFALKSFFNSNDALKEIIREVMLA